VPYLLRIATLGRWNDSTSPDWLSPGEMTADPLGDLKTIDGKLSVWVIDDEGENLDRVVAALAGARPRLDHFEFYLVGLTKVESDGFSIETSHGGSADPSANEKWHRDIIRISAPRLVKLASVLKHHGEPNTRLKKQVSQLLRSGLQAGNLIEAKLGKHILQDIGKTPG